MFLPLIFPPAFKIPLFPYYFRAGVLIVETGLPLDSEANYTVC